MSDTGGKSKHALLALLTCLAAVMLLASPSWAQATGDTVVVDDDGQGTAQDCEASDTAENSIQDAVDAANAGDTVLVCPGTYGENVSIDEDIALVSKDGRDATTIVGQGSSALGTIVITGGTTDVRIGGDGAGFHIIGIDNASPGIESAALYFQGPHTGSEVVGNEIEANGDLGLLGEFSAATSNFLVDGNVFSGKTFTGDTPGGSGFGSQFTTPNVPRQLVVVGNGATQPPSATGVTFTNNEITGTAGGINSDDAEQGNGLVTLDVADSEISGNTFSGTTNRFASALRVRQSGTEISNNAFDGSDMGSQTSLIFVQNGPSIQGNSINGADGAGAGIVVGNNSSGVTTASEINFNRIVNNASGLGVVNQSATAVDATNNWWGCNEGPESNAENGCDTTNGNVDSDPWLVMDITADPTTVEPGGTSNITVSFDQNSDDAEVGPGFPDGVLVSFTATGGTVDPPEDATENALAETVFTAGSDEGGASVTGALDAEEVTVNLTVEAEDDGGGGGGGGGGEQPPPPPVDPNACTITGTSGNDILRGTSGRDVICGLGGNDTIYGLAGNDVLRGGAGNDILYGGPGNDTIYGGTGNDLIRGQAGNDRLFGNAGQDRLNGGPGFDRFNGGPGRDSCKSTRDEPAVNCNS